VPLQLKVYENVFGIPSPDLHYLACTNDPSADPEADRFVVIRDLASTGEHTVGIGDYPGWSRDSQWLAYMIYCQCGRGRRTTTCGPVSKSH
jgi:hypothetical protein